MPARSLLPALALVLAAVLAGCATPYRAVDYDGLAYTGRQESHGVTFAYRYDAQPGAYGARARRRGYGIVAVEATNTTAAPVVLDTTTLAVFTGRRPIAPLAPAALAEATRQGVWTHLLWGIVVIAPDYDGDVRIPVGIPVAALNITVARSANRQAARSYAAEHLFGRTLAPGETAHALFYFASPEYVPLTFVYTPPAGAEGE